MFFVNTTMAGTCIATVPDVCKTPTPGGPVPIPYPNIAMLAQVMPATAAKKTKILNRPVVVSNSTVSMSSGNEAGTVGGIISSLIKGPASFVTFSLKVKVEGQPATYHTCQTKQNGSNGNTLGMVAAPSQTKVTLMG